MKQKDEELTREIELFKWRLEELEQLAKGRGLVGFFSLKHGHAFQDGIANSK